MNMLFPEQLIHERVRESHTQARRARVRLACMAARRARRAERKAQVAAERADLNLR